MTAVWPQDILILRPDIDDSIIRSGCEVQFNIYKLLISSIVRVDPARISASDQGNK